MFEEAGCRVMTAQDGTEAIAIFNGSENDFDLAILDVVMPGSSGLDVVDHIRKSDRPTKVLLTNGYSIEFGQIMSEDDPPLMVKPFQRAGLLQRVRLLLEG